MKDITVKVIKRDGQVSKFDSNKIYTAIQKGFDSIDEPYEREDIKKIQNKVLYKIYRFYNNKENISIETIQNIVIDKLYESGYSNVADSYKKYSDNRNRARKDFGDQSIKLARDLENLVKPAVESNDKRDNGNVDGDSIMGTMLQFGSTVSKSFATNYLMDARFADAYKSGAIHIHDLDFLAMGATTCLQIPLDKMFEKGFNTGHGYLRTPGSITSAASLAAIAIQSNQNEHHGGQSIPAFDYYLAPYVLKSFKKNFKEILENVNDIIENKFNDKEINIIEKVISNMDTIKFEIKNLFPKFNDKQNDLLNKIYEKAYNRTDRQTYQAMEAFVHNLNTMHSRAGAQVPFSSINFGTDISPEGRMVSKNYLLAHESGLGHHETPIFPIAILKVKRGINFRPEDPNYDLYELSLRVTAKRLFPNFNFLDSPMNYQFLRRNDGKLVWKAKEKWYKEKGYIDYDTSKIEKSEDLLLERIKKVKELEDKLYKEEKYSDIWSETAWIYYNKNMSVEEYKGKDLGTPTFGTDIKTEAATMGCRTRVFGEVVPEYGKTLLTSQQEPKKDHDLSEYCWAQVVARGNLSFTSINMPRLAIECMDIKDKEERIEKFFKKLEYMMDLCRDQLLQRFEIQGNKKVYNFNFLMGQELYLDSYTLGKRDKVRPALRHGSLTIGFIGLAETLIALIGKHHGESEEAQELGLRIIKFMRDKCYGYSKSTGLNFGIIGTPAEGLSGRFTRIDKNLFGVIPGITDKKYYTNSSHVPVYYNITAAKKIEIESKFVQYESAGNITYIELDGDLTKNLEAVDSIIKIAEANNICYFSINHAIDTDPVCGFSGIINGDKCPGCGRKLNKDEVTYRKLESKSCDCI